MRHEIKIKESFADAIVGGDKTFEIRYNDRGYQKGDIVIFQCVNNNETFPQSIGHNINYMVFEIDYVLSGYGLKEGFCVFGFHKILGDDSDKENLVKEKG